MNNMSFAVTAALFEGALAVLAVCLGWALNRPPLATFRLNSIGLGWGIFATLPPLALLWLCIKSPWRPFARIMQLLDETFIPFFRQCRMLELAVIALLAGLGEEMLFRGIVQGWVTDKVGGPYGVGIGLAVAAVIFGLLHGITFTYALLAGGIGLYFGAIWLATGNLLVPITSHALYDFLALLYFVHLRKSKNIPEQAQDQAENRSE
jgi:membrane protease YdiL (CAAX protease family)